MTVLIGGPFSPPSAEEELKAEAQKRRESTKTKLERHKDIVHAARAKNAALYFDDIVPHHDMHVFRIDDPVPYNIISKQ